MKAARCDTKTAQLVIILVLTAVTVTSCGIGGPAPQNDVRYRKAILIRDSERRCVKLGDSSIDTLLDAAAYSGMPNAYTDTVTDYVASIWSAIMAVPIKRQRFYHEMQTRRPSEKLSCDERYPDSVNPVYDRDLIVPIFILPRPDVVRLWSRSNDARSFDWLSEDEARENRGFVFGSTLIFEPGKTSREPVSVPASPFETEIPSWDLYTPAHDHTFFRDLGKLVRTPTYVTAPPDSDDGPVGSAKDEEKCLDLGKPGGAKLAGKLVSVPLSLENRCLRWVTIQTNHGMRRFLAYSLLDGNGPKRATRFTETIDGSISPYIRPLVCPAHQPKIKQHDELLLPTPIDWPLTSWDRDSRTGNYNAHEEWCLDDWFPAQADACWVIREADDSKPLQESFLLMPASEKSDRPVFFIALFAETKPEQLIKELAALYKVDANTALNSRETMDRLNSLFQKIVDLPKMW